MQVLVVGGTGMAGSQAVAKLLERGHAVRVMTRRSRGLPDGATAAPGDLRTGDGLDAALDGVDAVVNTVNSGDLRRRAAEQVHVEGTKRLLGAARRAGVGHYIGISIVGIGNVPGGYYTAKRNEERVLEQSAEQDGVPWSLLRATQFHQLLDAALAGLTRSPVLPLPTAVVLQPVDALHAGVRLAALVEEGPSGVAPELGGPRRETIGDLAAQWMRARGRRRVVLPVPVPGGRGRALREGALCPAQAGPGPSFGEWLAGYPA